jgi:hypothetical protein
MQKLNPANVADNISTLFPALLPQALIQVPMICCPNASCASKGISTPMWSKRSHCCGAPYMGKAATAPPISAMNSRRLMRLPKAGEQTTSN